MVGHDLPTQLYPRNWKTVVFARYSQYGWDIVSRYEVEETLKVSENVKIGK